MVHFAEEFLLATSKTTEDVDLLNIAHGCGEGVLV